MITIKNRELIGLKIELKERKQYSINILRTVNNGVCVSMSTLYTLRQG